MGLTYDKPPANTWIEAQMKGHKISCCDCGLVHDVDFRIYKGKIQFRVRRNNRSTGQLRRWNNITL